jgi:hypothetical protein
MPSTSGQSHEGWMSLIPLSVMLFIVIVALGGPDPFVHTVTSFAAESISYIERLIRNF